MSVVPFQINNYHFKEDFINKTDVSGPHEGSGVHYLSLTYLQLSLDPSFASLPKRHLSLVVLGHDLHKLPGQHSVLKIKKKHKDKGWECGYFRVLGLDTSGGKKQINLLKY